jgi:hypothetical protein
MDRSFVAVMALVKVLVSTPFGLVSSVQIFPVVINFVANSGASSKTVNYAGRDTFLAGTDARIVGFWDSHRSL